MSTVAQGSGFDGTSMAGGMGGIGDSMGKEFGASGKQLGGISGFLKQHLGGGPAGAQAAANTAKRQRIPLRKTARRLTMMILIMGKILQVVATLVNSEVCIGFGLEGFL